MTKPILMGAVAYDPKVVPIWDGIREYLQEAGNGMDYVLFSNYEAQVDALVSGFIDIAWNTNLAYVDYSSVIVVRKGAGINSLADLRGRTLALGSRDSGHAAILPLYFLKRQDIDPQRELKLVRFDLDVGKHGDTGASESAVLNAVASGQADAGAVGDPFWAKALEDRAVDGDKVRLLWNTPAYHHCNFTALDSLDQTRFEPWVETLLRMDYNNAKHRPLLDMEGLKRWLPGQTEGYRTLFEAVEEQGIE